MYAHLRWQFISFTLLKKNDSPAVNCDNNNNNNSDGGGKIYCFVFLYLFSASM